MRVPIFIFMLSVMICSCNREKKAAINQENHNKTKTADESNIIFNIKKIDSTPNLYLIYALNSGKYYKILSEKESEISDCKEIKLNEKYEFELDTIYSKRGVLEHVSAIIINDQSTVYFEGDSIKEFYASKNIKGLCYYPAVP